MPCRQPSSYSGSGIRPRRRLAHQARGIDLPHLLQVAGGFLGRANRHMGHVRRHLAVHARAVQAHAGSENTTLYPAIVVAGADFPGCSRPRVRGVSWTMDRKVAERFARGRRFIPVPDPVVAEAVVEREAVFAVLNERKESELLIDPRRLRKLVVQEWEGKTLFEELQEQSKSAV